MSILIRPYQPEDFDAITLLWRQTREDAFPEFQRNKGHTFSEDRAYFRDVILINNQVWVAEAGGNVAGFIAINGSFIDHLFVAPAFQRRGIGHVFLEHARKLSPDFLRLYTFQFNQSGRTFYEKNGFRAIKFGISPPPESEPDVEYYWP